MAWVVVSLVLVEGIDGFHLIVSHAEIEDVNILGQSFRLNGFWNCSSASLNCPPEQDLSSSLLVFGCNVLHSLLFHDRIGLLCHIEFPVSGGTQVAEGSDCHALLFAESDKSLLRVVWM